jgi:hypothetical protein
MVEALDLGIVLLVLIDCRRYCCRKYYTVTGAIVCSRVTYSICRYDNNNKSKRGYSQEDIRENICCDFKRNNILDRCYRDEEGNTRGPYAPYIHRLSVFLFPLATALSFSSPTSFSSSLLFIV